MVARVLEGDKKRPTGVKRCKKLKKALKKKGRNENKE